MNISVSEFFIENLKKEEINNKKVLEVGSKYVNGSVRPIIEKFFQPEKYVGIDIEQGKFVDEVLPAEKLIEHFGQQSFDVVISTELLEHVKDWRIVIHNMKGVLKEGGVVYITTRSKGFPYHSYPYDFWRYEIDDMKNIFSDFIIEKLEKDNIESPGVFLNAKKPFNFKENDLTNYELYSILEDKRIKDIDGNDIKKLQKKFLRKEKLKNFYLKLGKSIYHKI